MMIAQLYKLSVNTDDAVTKKIENVLEQWSGWNQYIRIRNTNGGVRAWYGAFEWFEKVWDDSEWYSGENKKMSQTFLRNY